MRRSQNDSICNLPRDCSRVGIELPASATRPGWQVDGYPGRPSIFCVRECYKCTPYVSVWTTVARTRRQHTHLCGNPRQKVSDWGHSLRSATWDKQYGIHHNRLTGGRQTWVQGLAPLWAADPLRLPPNGRSQSRCLLESGKLLPVF